MQEIAPHVYIETGYIGVTLGAINWSHGLILIDCPFRLEDARSWRSALLNLGGGVDRMMVNLDGHHDRTIGGRAMECTVVAHQDVTNLFRARSSTFKTNPSGSGAEWELYSSLGTIRWALPEISFSEKLLVYWDDSPMSLEYHPGSADGAVWAVLPEQSTIFLGDSVMPFQPPFLETANIPLWIESLQELLTDKYQNYLLISGRDGLVTHNDVRNQISQLAKIDRLLDSLAAENAVPEETNSLVPKLLEDYEFPINREIIYQQRLSYGLKSYYSRISGLSNSEAEEV